MTKGPGKNTKLWSPVIDARAGIVCQIKQLDKERELTANGLSRLAAMLQTTIKSILNGENRTPGTITIKSFVTVWKLPWMRSYPPPYLTHWNKKK